MTLHAMLPEKYHPAWGTIPPVKVLSETVSVLYSLRKPLISFSHAEASPGYQLPEKMDLLTFMSNTSFLCLNLPQAAEYVQHILT
jgi:hypothetical protein